MIKIMVKERWEIRDLYTNKRRRYEKMEMGAKRKIENEISMWFGFLRECN